MGLALKEYRQARGLTMRACADALGVKIPSYYAWEAGKTYPTADKLPALAALFGCSINDLYHKGDPHNENTVFPPDPSGHTPPHDTILPEEVRPYHGI